MCNGAFLRAADTLGVPQDARDEGSSRHFDLQVWRLNLLLFRRAAKDFVYLVLLVSWMDGLEFHPPLGFDLVEFFSGHGRLCRLASLAGYESRGYDVTYEPAPHGESKHSDGKRRSCYDFLGEAGFAWLVIQIHSVLNGIW